MIAFNRHQPVKTDECTKSYYQSASLANVIQTHLSQEEEMAMQAEWQRLYGGVNNIFLIPNFEGITQCKTQP